MYEHIKGSALGAECVEVQGYQKCDPSMLLHRPKSVDEVLKIIKAYDRVQATGSGLSWNREMVLSPSFAFSEWV